MDVHVGTLHVVAFANALVSLTVWPVQELARECRQAMSLSITSALRQQIKLYLDADTFGGIAVVALHILRALPDDLQQLQQSRNTQLLTQLGFIVQAAAATVADSIIARSSNLQAVLNPQSSGQNAVNVAMATASATEHIEVPHWTLHVKVRIAQVVGSIDVRTAKQEQHRGKVFLRVLCTTLDFHRLCAGCRSTTGAHGPAA
jgi:hypothetical protein